jgi:hypothetical protein
MYDLLMCNFVFSGVNGLQTPGARLSVFGELLEQCYRHPVSVISNFRDHIHV